MASTSGGDRPAWTTKERADRLWKDDGTRKGLVAQVEHQPQATSGTEALDRLEDLNLPIGWEEANRPGTAGEWLLTGLG